jgi:predicted metalloendopeptidase
MIYNSILDTVARNKAGLKPLQPTLDAIASIKTLNDMRKALAVNEPHFANFKKIVTEQDKFRSKYLYEYHEQLGELLYGPTQQCLF